jgi:NADH-dependent peroxiredoxin subunit C
MVRIRGKVPDFELDAYYDGDIKKIRLSDYKGKWVVLMFYPADFTFVCPTELEDLASLHDEFTKLDAVVLSVSKDTAFVHKAWHDESPAISKIKFPMLADPTGSLCMEFGTYIYEEGLSFRGSFIIDPDGILRAMEMNDNNIGRNAAELLRKLQAAVHVRENPVEACPARWVPGGKTLKPGVDLIGKI